MSSASSLLGPWCEAVMSESDYAYECMRADLLGLPKPDKDSIPARPLQSEEEDIDMADGDQAKVAAEVRRKKRRIAPLHLVSGEGKGRGCPAGLRACSALIKALSLSHSLLPIFNFIQVICRFENKTTSLLTLLWLELTSPLLILVLKRAPPSPSPPLDCPRPLVKLI